MSFVERQISVTFTLASGTFSESGTDTVTLSGLRTSAKIVKAGGASLGSAQLTIYGMTLSLMNELSTLGMTIREVPSNAVTIAAGDAVSGVSTVYQGNIANAWADFESMPEVAFRVEAYVGLGPAAQNISTTSFDGSTDVATAMSGLASKMGYTFENNGVSVKLSSPHLWGSAYSQAQQLAQSAGCYMIVDNGTLAIWPKNGSRSGQALMLSPTSGLIGYPAYASQGISVKAVFNPNVKYGSQIQVQSSLPRASGIWTVLSIACDLESVVPRGEWSMTLSCWNPSSGSTPPVSQ
jgi:hypothetical protein